MHIDHGQLFPCCEHGALEPRMWIKSGSKAHKELIAIASSKLLCRDIKKLSPAEQTSSLESYHKIVTFFAPKSVHYFFPEMQARILIAALHFNENSNRSQATSGCGDPCWAVSFPKSRRGEAVVKEVKVSITYNYVNMLLSQVFELRTANPSYTKAINARLRRNDVTPLPIASAVVKTDKADLVRDHKKRFNT